MLKIRHIPDPEAHRRSALMEGWQNLLKRSEIGFPKLTERDQDWSAIVKRAAEVGCPERLIVVGIGGSSLGVQVIAEAFSPQAKCPVAELAPSPCGDHLQEWKHVGNFSHYRKIGGYRA
jgi:glucose-6-phosphate isomerase